MNLYQTIHIYSGNLYHQLSGKYRKRILNSSVSFGLLFILAVSASTAQKINEWPGFHGAGRTNKSDETGLIKDWPKDGPKLLLTVQGLGDGYGYSESVLVDGDYLYTRPAGKKGFVVCLNKLNGKLIWVNTEIPETVWQTELMDNHHGGIILHNGYLYGSGSNSRGWFCLDFQTGKQLWNSDGKGSLTFAAGMLYLLDEKGTMKHVRATPDKFELHGEFKVPSVGKDPFWVHPVVFGGRLYIRHSDKLFVYDISGNLPRM